MQRQPADRSSASQPPSVELDLYQQPGHLIRRANQIANAVFLDLVGEEVTTVQYALLRMVQEQPGVDQATLAGLVALDKSTAAMAAARLEGRGLLQREVDPNDRRQLRLSVTPAGVELLQRLVPRVHQQSRQLLAALDEDERELFLQLLRKFVQLHNQQSRAPLMRGKQVA